eukprot:15449725-Alexandrium_andersonii.AAC.1
MARCTRHEQTLDAARNCCKLLAAPLHVCCCTLGAGRAWDPSRGGVRALAKRGGTAMVSRPCGPRG